MSLKRINKELSDLGRYVITNHQCMKNYSGFQIQNGESKREPYDKNNRNQKKKNRKKKYDLKDIK